MPFRAIVLCCSFFLLSLPGEVWAQGPPSTAGEYAERYRQRIRQENLFGVYIPADVPEALQELYRRTSSEGQKAFAGQPEHEAVRNLHFSLGRWIIHNWGFYGGSRLSHYFREQLGIYHPDDMARFLMIAFHRSLNQKPLQIPELMATFHARQDSVRAADRRRDSLARPGNLPPRGQ